MFTLIFINQTWRAGRVVECDSLENCYTARYQGFESLALRRQGRPRSVYTLCGAHKSRESHHI